MKKIVSFLSAVLFGIIASTSISIFTSAEITNPEYSYTIQDLRNLQDFLIAKPTEEKLAEKPYDLNADEVWNVFDFCLMKQAVMNRQEKSKLKINVNGHILTATLADNSSAQAFAKLINNEPMVLNLNEYGSFEKVGALPQSIPTNDERITTKPGDIMLYQGNQMTIFYGSNTWSYTRLGKIDNITQSELNEIFGEGNVTVTLSILH